MKEVIINFIGTGINDEYQAYITLYDECGIPIYKGNSFNGELVICLKKDRAYYLKAISCKDVINTFFYVSKKQQRYTFIFKRSIYNLKTIIFSLFDANYANLPIEKGELTIWKT